MSEDKYRSLKINNVKSAVYVKQEPMITDDGIYMPFKEYAPEGCASIYRLIMTKDMLVEAYYKRIKGTGA